MRPFRSAMRLAIALLALPVLVGAQVATAPQGAGTAQDPYRIATLGNLQWLAQDTTVWGKAFRLTADIDASPTRDWNQGAGFAPIGRTKRPFQGSVHGAGHTISGLRIKRPTQDTLGLFGVIGDQAILDSIRLVVDTLSGRYVCGGLVAYNGGGQILHSEVRGGLDCTSGSIGGLVGINDGTIRYSHAHARISESRSDVGGLVGVNDRGLVEFSFAKAEIFRGEWVGGLVGNNGGTIRNSYSTGWVDGSGRSVGGLIGANSGGSVRFCYTDVTAWSLVGLSGAFVGSTSLSGPIDSSYWIGEEVDGCGDQCDAGFRAQGLSEENMRRRSQFVGWDFDSVWTIQEGMTYPMLRFKVEPITFDPIPLKVTTDGDFAPWAWAGPGLPLEIASSNPAVATIIGGRIHIVGPGRSTITVRVSDGSPHPGAQQVSRTLEVVSPPAGQGTKADPYRIASASDLRWIAAVPTSWNGVFVQTSDLDLSESVHWGDDSGYVPIGNRSSPFKGSYDGQGKTITGLTINKPESGTECGLFGFVGGGARVERVHLRELAIRCYGSAGGVAGVNFGTIAASSVTGAIRGPSASNGVDFDGVELGGIAGYNEGRVDTCRAAVEIAGTQELGGLVGSNVGAILASSASGNVSGLSTDLGGLVGDSYGGSIQLSHASGSVSGRDSSHGVGGLVGSAMLKSLIARSYATGAVQGNWNVGGLIGSTSYSDTVRWCYATGSARGAEQVGGLVGLNEGLVEESWSSVAVLAGDSMSGAFVGSLQGRVSRSYWDETVPAPRKGVGIVDVTGNFSAEGLAPEKMRMKNSFVGWDFVKNWRIDEGRSYPQLLGFSDPQPNVRVESAPVRAALAQGDYPVIVYDLRGAQVWKGQARWNGAGWQLPRLGAGTWIVRAQVPGRTIATRVAVLR